MEGRLCPGTLQTWCLLPTLFAYANRFDYDSDNFAGYGEVCRRQCRSKSNQIKEANDAISNLKMVLLCIRITYTV